MIAPIVMKFGGAALGDGARVRQAARLVAERRAERPIVVVSAASGVTDLLERAARDAAAGIVDARTIRLRHRGLLSQLGLEPELLNRLLTELGFVLDAVRTKGRLEPRERDVILSFGERMSARVFAPVLRREGVEASPVDAFDLGLTSDSNYGRARPLPAATSAMARALASIPGVPVVTGFLAIDPQGDLTTLGRNGSDLTAALVGESVRAKEVQFWKTVDGVMTADPKVVPSARAVENLSWREAALLGFFGAKVLFPEALEPLERARIAARVCSVDRASEPGTRVDAGTSSDGPRAIACRRRVVRVAVELGGLEARAERRSRFLAALADAQLELYALDEGPDELVGVVGESEELAAVLQNARARASITRDLALVTLVGRAAPELETLPVRAAWVRPESVSLLVDEAELERTARELHARCFEASAPSLA
ncbi:MAG: aspartate kinase [Planctomycetes bacterium]|nr:aspartate kinase [Planctomycetota bacterium]